MWERPCQLPLIREIVGRLKNYEIICGKFVGRPGREILVFLAFFGGGLGLPRRAFLFVSCVMSPTPPQRSLYIDGPRQTSAAKSNHGSSGSLQLLRHRRGGGLPLPEALVHRLPLFGGAVEEECGVVGPEAGKAEGLFHTGKSTQGCGPKQSPELEDCACMPQRERDPPAHAPDRS